MLVLFINNVAFGQISKYLHAQDAKFLQEYVRIVQLLTWRAYEYKQVNNS